MILHQTVLQKSQVLAAAAVVVVVVNHHYPALLRRATHHHHQNPQCHEDERDALIRRRGGQGEDLDHPLQIQIQALKVIAATTHLVTLEERREADEEGQEDQVGQVREAARGPEETEAGKPNLLDEVRQSLERREDLEGNQKKVVSGIRIALQISIGAYNG